MSRRYRSGHLGEAVDLYVDGTLDPTSMRLAARHVLVCVRCRQDVDAERAIVREVRCVPLDPARHATLVAGLLALSAEGASSSTTAPWREGADRRAARGDRENDDALPDGVHAWDDEAHATPHPDGATQRHHTGRRVAGLAVVGVFVSGLGVGAVVMGPASLVGPSHSSPMAPQQARSSLVRADRLSAPTVRVAPVRVVARAVGVTPSSPRSGRMDP